MSNNDSNFDVVIAGGGLVGSTLACILAHSGRFARIALVEAAAPAPWQGEYDIRVSAITPASRNIFQAIDVWPDIQQQRVSPFYEMHVWDAGGDGVIHFDSADIGVAELGYIIENRVMLKALEQCLAAHDAIQRFQPGRVDAINFNNDAVAVTLDDEQVLHTPLLVGADGSASPCRSMAGIHTRGWDYEQTAVVATIQTGEQHCHTAWQRFLPTGPLAFLPLPDPHLCSIVWSTTPEQARALLAMAPETFLAQLHQAVGDPLGSMVRVLGERAAFPLRLQHAEHYCRPGFVLVGDAAHTVHPLAGQGVNLGLADVATLAEVLLQGMQSGRAAGDMRDLRHYERWRKGDNLSMMFTFDGFKRLFSNDITALRWLRNGGLDLMDRLAPVKQSIMRHSLGIHGDSPSLSRGVMPGKSAR
jgi:2-octaprenylphenol hydroxylase